MVKESSMQAHDYRSEREESRAGESARDDGRTTRRTFVKGVAALPLLGSGLRVRSPATMWPRVEGGSRVGVRPQVGAPLPGASSAFAEQIAVSTMTGQLFSDVGDTIQDDRYIEAEDAAFVVVAVVADCPHDPLNSEVELDRKRFRLQDGAVVSASDDLGAIAGWVNVALHPGSSHPAKSHAAAMGG
jgi:hypothetical protein